MKMGNDKDISTIVKIKGTFSMDHCHSLSVSIYNSRN